MLQAAALTGAKFKTHTIKLQDFLAKTIFRLFQEFSLDTNNSLINILNNNVMTILLFCKKNSPLRVFLFFCVAFHEHNKKRQKKILFSHSEIQNEKSSHYYTKGSDTRMKIKGNKAEVKLCSHLENCMKHSTAINIFYFNLTLFRALCRSAFIYSSENNMEPIKRV